MEVDKRTHQEYLKEGRIKILLDKSVTLPLLVPIWVEGLRFMVLVEHDREDLSRQESKERGGKGWRETDEGRGCNCRSQPGREEEDDDATTLGFEF